MDDDERIKKELADPRLGFFENFVTKLSNTKVDKWRKMISMAEHRETLFKFMNDPTNRLILFLNNGALMIPHLNKFPEDGIGKGIFVYFLRISLNTELTVENLRDALTFGSCSNNPIRDLSTLTDEVFVPILTNPLNQVGWPKVLGQDISLKLQELRNNIAETMGNMNNRTILPMPITLNEVMNIVPEILAGNLDKCSLDIKESLEQVVIKWAKSINMVISEESYEILQTNKNATPADELRFWDARLKNLENIFMQLSSEEIKTITLILEKINSIYLNPFKRAFASVNDAIQEASDLYVFLQTLENQMSKMETIDFSKGQHLILPVLHTVVLIWSNSKYCCTNKRMIHLFKLIHNMLIEQATICLDPESVFRGDADDTLIKVKKIIHNFQMYKEIQGDYRSKLNTYVPSDSIKPLWSFKPEEIYSAFDMFVSRLKDLENIFETTFEFKKLEDIVFGGDRGRRITRSIQKIVENFQLLYSQLENIKFNPLCLDAYETRRFNKMLTKFTSESQDLERSIATQFNLAFDDYVTTSQYAKLMINLGTALYRPIVFEQLSSKFVDIVYLLEQEIVDVKNIFDEKAALIKNNPTRKYSILNSDFSALVGNLLWLRQLKARINDPIEYFSLLKVDVFDTDFGRHTKLCIEKTLKILEEFKNDVIINVWIGNFLNAVHTFMEYTLLRRGDNNELMENFADELCAAFKGLNYLALEKVSYEQADLMQFWNKENDLWNVRMKLLRIIEWYNFVTFKTHETEKSLILSELSAIDESLTNALTTSKWNSYDETYVTHLYNVVKDLYDRIQIIQKNLKTMTDNIATWNKMALYMRKKDRNSNLLDIKNRQRIIHDRFLKCLHTKKLIDFVMLDNYRLFNNIQVSIPSPPMVEDPDATRTLSRMSHVDSKIYDLGEINDFVTRNYPPEIPDELIRSDSQALNYLPYEKYVDNIVSTEILAALEISLRYIRNEMENVAEIENPLPLFEIKFVLQNATTGFIPNLNVSSQNGFVTLITSLVVDIYGMADMITRIAPDTISIETNDESVDNMGKVPTYETILAGNDVLEKLRNDIMKSVSEVAKNTLEEFKKYQIYEAVWIIDRKKYLNEFLKYGRHLTKTDMFNIDNDTFDEKKLAPTLKLFEDEIYSYQELQTEISNVPSFIDPIHWLRVDLKEFKSSMLFEIRQWIKLFIGYLKNHVIESLQELEDFIERSKLILNQEIEKHEFDKLVEILSILSQVEQRTLETDSMFEPLKNEVELLKKFNEELEPNINTQFADLPEKWNKTKKAALLMTQTIAPVQIHQVDLIRKRVTLLEIRIICFRSKFKEIEFFDAQCTDAYKFIDTTNRYIKELERQAQELRGSVTLFSVEPPDCLPVEKCRKETKLLKQLWDYVNAIRCSIDTWKTTPWKKIDVEAMDIECKKFGKELRSLDKDTRGWDPYITAESSLKNLMTSLRAVTELQNPALRDRHWFDLKKITNIEIKIDSSTTLANLLDLNLYRYEEDVKNIVDKSVKEGAMEKMLRDISTTWTQMEFEYEIHGRTELKVLRMSEELIEVLEDNQVQLQNMLSSKFVGYFLNTVTEWQSTLSNVDQVIRAWFEVQRKWTYLESIFIGSEDIRKQLPEDTERFAQIDHTFKIKLSDIVSASNVINACSAPGLFESLEKLQQELILCERALNNYLETKRLAFPRFYFVSSADLLDILSNGSQPTLVGKHLIKLYDSLAKLLFRKNTKLAYAMISKENEECVEFIAECDCDGQVEIWLNRVSDNMKKTLHSIFFKSLIAYDEKPRDEWILDWPAQPALCVTQISWSNETNEAFVRLEGGYENALRDYQKKQILQLNALINLLLGDLSKGERQKIMTVCTIDVHSRDVISKMIVQKIRNTSAFQWQSQLRHRWDANINDCFVNICDAQFRYDFEYLGNTPRLVITPLTDRCYITLTQSLHLIMGGAPAGPAGTGKTETTKDLGKGLGMMVYVFNCSEQMDYKSCGNIYKGLSITGAWGCFDEFNRISVEVLSVVAVQVKTILDAIKSEKSIFNFMGNDIKLVRTVGLFITMNPGYAGRTELPENLKSLFRPCAMVVPDFALISEIMLVAEGFQEARILSQKFITLYTLCRELLSKQDHYDWGLRAIKSVLVVAGALKRSDRNRPEDQVLMRALRDFNIPKIVTDDVSVFMGLIGDLFPALDVPRKRDEEFENVVKQSAIDLHLQPDDNFVLKIVQLEELFAVRHSVFIVGFAGTGKSQVWKTLFQTYQNQKRKPHFNVLNPKAVTNDELFGVINPTTREWKDGLFSVIMRDQANMSGNGPKWIVLDGDIDPMWIESLNTLMDDNKILTLASNERIALTNEMRLIFEIATLKSATPATVSRAGILYINAQDLGWSPYVTSWIEKRSSKMERSLLTVLFDRYIPTVLNVINNKMKQITPMSDIAMIQMTCDLLESLLTPNNLPNACPKEWYEIYFVFAVIWGFGSTLFQDQIIDWRNEFSKWWTNEFKFVKFPADEGNIFNFYIDSETKAFQSWSNLVPQFYLNPDIPMQSTLVSTAETICLRYFIDLLIAAKLPVMLVGGSGTGKSVILADKLNSLSSNYVVTNVPFNYYTTSEMLQAILEKPLEKKTGRSFGPSGSKTMIYFIDDMNMPEVDIYGTVQPHTIIRQFMDYRHWYDRVKLTLKDIQNCQFVSCMNPVAGSFTIDPRLQRHFCTFAVNVPGTDAMFHIYHNILSQHVENPMNNFSKKIVAICESVVRAAIALHQRMNQMFLPTAAKFHYNFNLRELANIFSGMLCAKGECCPNENMFVRLWLHESARVYGDKLTNDIDLEMYAKQSNDIVSKSFEGLNHDIVFEKPNIFFHFAESLNDAKYMPVTDWNALNKILEDAQIGYNEIVGDMSLVLFEDAMSHICRISRILSNDRGYALLIGVGGSGKQTLTRLAAYISSLDVFQTQIGKGFSVIDLKADLATLYLKAGIKNTNCCYLMTDSQVAHETFLVVINDLLATGNILDLFPPDEVDNIVSAMRNEVKQAGLIDSKENCWNYFIDKVRRLLKVVLCFSPVGSTLRVRARKFPALINCTSIDWFHEWPTVALESVSNRFLADIDVLPHDLVNSVAIFMAYVHGTVNDMSKIYLQNEKRFNYTTPKTFLELIALYSKIISNKHLQLTERINTLETGLLKLADCAEQVDGLQEILSAQEVVLSAKKNEADKQLAVVTYENNKVQTEKNFAAEKEKKVRIIEEDVSAKTKVCAADLKKAEPAVLKALAALDTLDKNNLTEMRSFGSPPKPVVNVCAAVLVLFTKSKKVPPIAERTWKHCKTMMGKVDKFLSDLKNYDKKNIRADVIEALMPYINAPDFNSEKIRVQSAAAAGLCEWVINIYKFYEVYLDVGPKERALIKSETELKEAQDTLLELNTKLEVLQSQLDVLQAQLDEATEEKAKCQAEADKTEFTIQLAFRLVDGLASEKIRWQESIEKLNAQINTLPGDILMISCFLSYVGCFTSKYRTDLQNNNWIPKLEQIEPLIPVSADSSDPLEMICDEADIAKWNNEGLPNDRMSIENASILINSARWPLMIDPQLQGIKWIKQKYGDAITVTRLTARNYLDVIEKAIVNGDVLLIENIGETIDAVLDPLLGRVLVKKGKVLCIGEKEIDYNPSFRLIMQTKLGNPHYKPEMQAQMTLINFTVTRDGLKQQLLAEVVKAERPDLEQLKANLTQEQNSFKIMLKKLEDDLLQRLSSAGDNVLEDETLVLNLEATKNTAIEIESKVKQAKITTIEIDEAREQYRLVAERAAILYFILNDLHKMNPIYQFSLKAFTVVFHRAILCTESTEELFKRVSLLLDSITYHIFMYTSRALFEQDKLTFMAQIAIQILIQNGLVNLDELDFLLRFPHVPNLISPLEFLSNTGWGAIVMLSKMNEFSDLDKDIEGSFKRWQKLVDSQCPEKEKLPGEWKNKSPIQRLCIFRALRPDRMCYAIKYFVDEQLGSKYGEARMMNFAETFIETSNLTHTFFTLSPGVNPLKDVEQLGKKMNYSPDFNNFHSVSLGQGQEIVAEQAIDMACENGHWVILQNIHLVAKWLPNLEKKIEATIEQSNKNYRLFLSAEPAASAEYHIIPQGILESAIKITNEPPTGMLANLHKSLDNFNEETLDMCSKVTEFKSILFSLCYFHAVVAERRKFGAQGWNRIYPFNFGDLTISVNVLHNYLEANNNVPWEDLRYLFGEIMYGGHITDDWDRRLCRTYLEEFMQPNLIDGELYLAADFLAPPTLDYVGYHKYIDLNLPSESPNLYGLHANTEIGVMTTVSEQLFKTLFELQPKGSESSSGSGHTHEEIVLQQIEDISDKIPEEFNIREMMARIDELTPYTIVAFQECDRMNTLMREIKRALNELFNGLKGILTITPSMELLDESIFYDVVPDSWSKLAYPSQLGLQSWFADLMIRLKELEAWVADLNLPSTVWLAGLFNPQSFLTAIMQQTARKNQWPLDRMCLNCEVTKKQKHEFTSAPREGAYINGLYMEGARWDIRTSSIVDAFPKELFPAMPVMYILAVTQDKQDTKNVYECPLYKVRMRGPTYVWTFNLKTKEKPSKWTLAGVCLLLQD